MRITTLKGIIVLLILIIIFGGFGCTEAGREEGQNG